MPLFQSFLPQYLILNSYFFATLMALTIGSAISSMPKNSQFPGIPSQYSYSSYIQYMLAHDHRMRVGVRHWTVIAFGTNNRFKLTRQKQ